MRDAVIGARADYNQTVNTSTSVSQSSLGVYAQASYDSGIGNVSASDSSLDSSMVQNYNQNATTNLVVIGGSAELGQAIFQSGDYDKWIASIPDNLVLADFTSSSLVPIWDLLPAGARQTQLEDAFAQYAQTKSAGGITGETALTALSLVDNGASPTPPSGWTQDPTDLNSGAGGKYIYIEVKY